MFEGKLRFSLGEISPGLRYRVETEIPAKGLAYLKNGLISDSAGLINFPSFEKLNTISVASELRTIEGFKLFKYKINKKDTSLSGYLFLYTNKKVLVLRMDNFQVVKEIPTTYTPEEIKNLSITQFENSVISCVANKEPVMVRVDEAKPDFTVVEYWKSITNPPVKAVESEYQYTDTDKLVFTWYQDGSKIIFESTLSSPVYKPSFLENFEKGTISYMGGEFRISKIENASGKQKITTSQVTAPGGNIEIPDKSVELEKKKINILDIVFSENLFRKGYPAVVTEYKGRVIFGNVAGNPSCVVSSRVFDSLNFRQSTEDNDGFTTFLAGNEVNTVVDFISYKSLIAVTDKGFFSTQLNTGLTPKTSEFYDQKLSRPKGLGYWAESDDAIYYVDTSNRIFQIQDVGADSAYKTMEVSTYSNHLFDNIEDIYFFKHKKNNLIGVDCGEEARALSYKFEEDIICWTRCNKLQGINEYVNVDDKLYIFNATGNEINIYTYSDTNVEPLEFKLAETSLSQKVRTDVPEFFKRTTIGQVKMVVIGDYDLSINGKRKEHALKLEDVPSDKVHFVTIPNTGKKELYIKQMNNNPIEIVGIFAEIRDFEQQEDE